VEEKKRVPSPGLPVPQIVRNNGERIWRFALIRIGNLLKKKLP